MSRDRISCYFIDRADVSSLQQPGVISLCRSKPDSLLIERNKRLAPEPLALKRDNPVRELSALPSHITEPCLRFLPPRLRNGSQRPGGDTLRASHLSPTRAFGCGVFRLRLIPSATLAPCAAPTTGDASSCPPGMEQPSPPRAACSSLRKQSMLLIRNESPAKPAATVRRSNLECGTPSDSTRVLTGNRQSTILGFYRRAFRTSQENV